MNQAKFYLLTCLLSFVLIGMCYGQQVHTFKHPALNFQVQAFDDWKSVPHPEDNTIFEIKDPESVLCVRMWYSKGNGPVADDLKNYARQKNLVFNGDPIKGKIRERDAWILDATCCVNKAPVRVVLIAIPDKTQPDSMYMAQVGCPESKLKEEESTMENIIYSFAVNE